MSPLQYVPTLYSQHADSARALASRLLFDRCEAEDVVQDVFLTLWRRPDRFDPARGTDRSWLLTVVRKLVSVKLVVVFTKVWPPNVTLPLTLPEESPYVVAMCSIGVPLRELMKCSTRLTVAAVLEPVLAQLPYQIM